MDASPSPSGSPQRLLSLDALRGFDMFWIIGGELIVHGLRQMSDNRAVSFLEHQLTHKDWEGFAFYDLIFPLFVFIVGVSLVFSLAKSVERHGRAATYRKVIVRSIILYALGLFYYSGMKEVGDTLRYVGVLQRIALCYLAGGLLYLSFQRRGLIIACVACLIGYWGLMSFVPVPELGSGNFAEGKNLANYIDQHYLPGYKWDGDHTANPLGTHDPEGLLSTIPAIGTCLLGVFAGLWLRCGDRDEMQKVRGLVLAGVGAVILGWLWGLQFPVIKKLWTSSYVLVAGGYSMLMLAAFYYIIDVRKQQRWCQAFVWIGMNAILLYMADNLLSFNDLARRVIKGNIADFLGSGASLAVAIIVMALMFLLARFLYQRKIFIRV